MFHKTELNNPHYDDCYFSYEEGIEEAQTVSVESSDIVNIATSIEGVVTVAETGFGTGLNFLALLMTFHKNNLKNDIDYYTVDKYPLTRNRIEELFKPFKSRLVGLDYYLDAWNQLFENITTGWNIIEFNFFNLKVNLHFYNGDVLDMLKSLNIKAYSWFLDGHSPHKNPEMWSEEVMLKVAMNTCEGGTFATFTAANAVREALQKGGFRIEKVQGFGGKRHMIRGVMSRGSNDK